MPNTHCLASGVLGTGELAVPGISLSTMSTSVPGGSKRGVVVLCHPLFDGPQVCPYPIQDISSFLSTLMLTLTNALVTDGWVVIQPPYQEDYSHQAAATFPNSPSYAIEYDISNDTGNGARYLASTLHWWDHVVRWIKANYGAWPIVPLGISWGGWRAFQVAVNRAADIIAYCGHCPVTILTHLVASISAPADWTGLTTTAADVGSSFLNSVSLPGLIGWSTADVAVGNTDPAALYNAAHTAGANVSFLTDSTNGHGLYATDIGPGGSGFTGTTIMDWFTNTVDPLAPKVH